MKLTYLPPVGMLATACVLACSSTPASNDADAAADAGLPCPTGRGPSMVRIPDGGGGTTCVDATEVTRAQYAQFLGDAANASAKRPSQCVDQPMENGPDRACLSESGVCQGSCDTQPQVCVTWCNAHAFCAWAGKKLCALNAWLNACGGGLAENQSGGGKVARNRYPYGSSYDGQACNTAERAGTGCLASPGSCTTKPVGSLSTCQSSSPSYAGVFDMSGNADEWIDAASTGTPPYVLYGGSSYATQAFGPSNDAACEPVGSAELSMKAKDLGFRCCAD